MVVNRSTIFRRLSRHDRRQVFEMRVLFLVAVLTASLSVAAFGAGAARATGGASAGCAGRTVKASASQAAAAKAAFTTTFSAIRKYLVNPTIPNQLQMYKRVDAGLFELYSYEGGQLNSNNGHVRGSFTFQYKNGTQCFDRTTRIVSFQVLVRARFTSTNRRKMVFDRLAHVQMKTPKIEHYIDPVTR
jgi:hypothetical protein